MAAPEFQIDLPQISELDEQLFEANQLYHDAIRAYEEGRYEEHDRLKAEESRLRIKIYTDMDSRSTRHGL